MFPQLLWLTIFLLVLLIGSSQSYLDHGFIAQKNDLKSGEKIDGFNQENIQTSVNVFESNAVPINLTSIKAINCTSINTGKYRWITFKGIPNGPLANGINSCYYFPDNYHLVSWHEARDFCQSIGGSLASIHNYTIDYLLSNRVNYGTDTYTSIYWIGLNSLTKRGVYKWSDNTPSDYFFFSNKTSTDDPIPTNILDQGRCVSFKSLVVAGSFYGRNELGKWFKEDCNANHKFICERKIDNSPPPTEPPAQGNCAQDWFQIENKKCVKYINSSMNFNQSKAQCNQLGGELLSIHSEEEQNFITAITAGKQEPYIGWKKILSFSNWNWDDQSKVNYDNLGYSVSLYYEQKLCTIVVTNVTQPGKWVPVNCNKTYSVICEKPLDPSISMPGMTFSTNKCKIPGFDNYIQYRNSCYSVVDNSFSKFADAENSCSSQKAHLLSIVDPFEEAFIKYYIKKYGKSDEYWIGLQSKLSGDVNVSQVFEWTDDWPVYYTNWAKYEPQFAGLPQEECVSMSNGTWRTTACDTSYPYICKITTNPLPKMNSDKSGLCPKIPNITDKTLGWIDIDKRSKYCYWFSVDQNNMMNTGFQSWTDAAYHCRRRNGTLASIHSNHDLLLMKNNFDKIGTYYSTWIGLTKDINGRFIWEDSTAVDYTNWDPNEKIVSQDPNPKDDSSHQCVEVKPLDQMWRLQPCSGSKRNYFVCEINKIYPKTSVSPTLISTTVTTMISTNTKKGSTNQLKTTPPNNTVRTTKSPIVGKQSSNDSDEGLSGGAKAGISIGIIGGVVIICLIGYFTFKRYRPNSPIISSFENSLYGSRRSHYNRGDNCGQNNDCVVTYSKNC